MQRKTIALLLALGLTFAANPSLSKAEGLGSWKVLAPTPTARTEVGVAVLNNKIYVIGGFTPDGIADRVEVYDPATQEWLEAAPLPRALHHVAVAAVNGKIYVVGGFATGMWTPVSTTYAYDPATDSWSEKARMPTERGALAAGVIDGKIHAVGGAFKKFFRLKNTGAHEVYDPATDTWTKAPDLPTPRDHLTVSAMNGKLYALGGRIDVDYNDNLDLNEAFDPKTGQWQTLAPVPTKRSGITSQSLNGNIFVFGGESGNGTFDENEAYDPATNTWKAYKPMPNSCHGLGSAVANGSIHLITGGPNPGGGGSHYHQVFTPPLQGEPKR